ncbi:cytochrome c4 [Ectothiorhodospiraceae bacterium 2226]|nr:cytochrome c4 [Ectothiorhodospiraceae bacterium 2226]
MKKTAIAALLMFGFSGASVAADVEAGRAIAQNCAACHGADGNSQNPEWPKLAAQHEGYLVKQLADFKGGARQDQLMSAQAQPLSEEDMRNVAAFYAQQRIQAETADQEVVALGERIYRGGNPASGVAACISCHGPGGAGNPAANFPRVAGQHAAYSAKTLRDFRENRRANDAGQMMRNIAARMTDEEIEAVSQYMAGLR